MFLENIFRISNFKLKKLIAPFKILYQKKCIEGSKNVKD